MKDSLILQDKNYISARRVHELFGYTSDYVGQLCRAGKLDCKMVGRSWFVTEYSIVNHKSVVSEVLKNKNKTYKNTKTTYTKKVVEINYTNVKNESNPIPLLLCAPIEFHPITLVPNSFSLPYSISESFILAPQYPKIDKQIKKLSFVSPVKTYAGVGVFVFAFIFIFQSVLFPNFDTLTLSKEISSSSVASVSSIASSVQKVFFDTVSIFTGIPKFAKEIFVNNSNNLAINNNDGVSFGGLAVTVSSGSEAKDEIIKQKIRDSFSDEVRVRPDQSGTAGVITPVFKKTTSDDFLYVLVPVSPNSK